MDSLKSNYQNDVKIANDQLRNAKNVSEDPRAILRRLTVSSATIRPAIAN